MRPPSLSDSGLPAMPRSVGGLPDTGGRVSGRTTGRSSRDGPATPSVPSCETRLDGISSVEVALVMLDRRRRTGAPCPWVAKRASMDVGARRGDSGDGRCLSLIRPLVGGSSPHRGASVGGVTPRRGSTCRSVAVRCATRSSDSPRKSWAPWAVAGAAGKAVDPQESLWDFKGREAKPVASDVSHGRQAAISGRSKRVSTCGREH